MENYQPEYPDVRRFSDSDMLLVKQTLERYQKYKNEAHKEAVLLLAEKICEQLDIFPVPEQKLKFLKTTLNDYIVLTR